MDPSLLIIIICCFVSSCLSDCINNDMCLCGNDEDCSVSCNEPNNCNRLNITCPSQHKCSINCTSNCNNMIISAINSTFLYLECNSLCNQLTIYCPINNNNKARNCELLMKTNSIYSNIQIKAQNGFNDINIISLSNQSNFTNNVIYCNDNYSSHCIINSTLNGCINTTICNNNNNNYISSTITTISNDWNMDEHDHHADYGLLVLYIGISVIIILIIICILCCIVYNKTKDNYSGRLKPTNFDYNRTNSRNVIKAKHSSMTMNKPKSKSKSNILHKHSHPPNNISIVSISSNATVSNVSAMTARQRESFTPTVTMMRESDGSILEMAESQKSKMSYLSEYIKPNIEPITELNEFDEKGLHDDDDDDDGDEDMDMGMDLDKKQNASIKSINIGLQDDKYNKVALDTPTLNDNDIDDTVVNFNKYPKQNLKGYHISVVSNSEQFNIDEDDDNDNDKDIQFGNNDKQQIDNTVK